MKTLKRLLTDGDNAAILVYVKSNDFAYEISEYEALSDKTRRLKKDYVKLLQESFVRSQELSELRGQIDSMAAKIRSDTDTADVRASLFTRIAHKE